MNRLLIFDFDGVVMDSEPLHFAKSLEVLREEGEELSWEDYVGGYLALNDRDFFAAVLCDRGWRWCNTAGGGIVRTGPSSRLVSEPYIKTLIDRKAAKFERDLATGLKPIPGTFDFVRRAAQSHAMAIASGALHAEIETILRLQGMRGFFGDIVGAEDVVRGKPYPDPFLKAMELSGKRLGIPIAPAECVVIEDSINGVDAAKEAGMKCIALTTSYPRERLGHADLVVDSLKEVATPVAV
ncbi:MAG: HAD family phosphatase [Myxococcota bacterium]|jgi:HAD superfamily hydrolase (TIGR01509 family)